MGSSISEEAAAHCHKARMCSVAGEQTPLVTMLCVSTAMPPLPHPSAFAREVQKVPSCTHSQQSELLHPLPACSSSTVGPTAHCRALKLRISSEC